jgi:type III secretion protein SpaR/YscT/HrcT
MDTVSATESYLSLLLSLPQLEPMTLLSVFFLTLARVIPIMSLAPFLGAKNIPGTLRMLFSVALVAIFLPQNLLHIKHNIFFTQTFIWLFLKELIIGFMLGIFSMVPFLISQMAGSLIDHQRGASSLQVTDPTTQSQTGPIGLLLNQVTIVLFFYLDGPFLFLNGVASSYQLIPIDGMISPFFFQIETPFWKQTVQLIQFMMNLSVQLAAPALIGILLTDMFLGIANRLAPQVQIVFLGIALKSWVGIALMTAAWGMMFQVINKESIQWMHSIQWFIEQIGHTYTKA